MSARAHQRRDLRVGDEARQEPDPSRRLVGQLPQRLEGHSRHPGDPELGALDGGERLEQGVDALVGTQEAEEEDHRVLRPGQLDRQRAWRGEVRQVVERAVRDHLDLRRVEADLVAEAGGGRLGVGDDGVEAVEVAVLGGELAGLARRRQRVVEREHPRAVGVALAEQPAIEPRHRRPLPVLDVGGLEPVAHGQHVRDVLERLDRQAAAMVDAAPWCCGGRSTS